MYCLAGLAGWTVASYDAMLSRANGSTAATGLRLCVLLALSPPTPRPPILPQALFRKIAAALPGMEALTASKQVRLGFTERLKPLCTAPPKAWVSLIGSGDGRRGWPWSSSTSLFIMTLSFNNCTQFARQDRTTRSVIRGGHSGRTH